MVSDPPALGVSSCPYALWCLAHDAALTGAVAVKPKPNRAYQSFVDGLASARGAVRIKDIRGRELVAGGRAHLALFVGEGGREHPRLRVNVPVAVDPRDYAPKFAPKPAPRDLDGLRAAIDAALHRDAQLLAGRDLRVLAPAVGGRYRRNSIVGQRRLRFFAAVRAGVERLIARRFLARTLRRRALGLVREMEDLSFVGPIDHDDTDTGTYHSYAKDAAFVHYLERIAASLPSDGSKGMAVLDAGAQESIRRQRDQLSAHLDAVMRDKYAYSGTIDESDIERTVGGMLIDRETRTIASIVADSDPIAPSYEILRIDPAADHRHAGAWVWRDAAGRLRLQDGARVSVPADALRSRGRTVEQLTFQRAPGDRRLRPGMRFDWDGSGHVQAAPLDWVSWAGHCDVKAVMESLGLALVGQRPLVEYRSDTSRTLTYDRSLLLEMLASVIELGSDYRSIDGTNEASRGQTTFGGARNDAAPDQLRFGGENGRSFVWPRGGRTERCRVTRLVFADGERADLGSIFFRNIGDVRTKAIVPNPRWISTVDDVSTIDVTGATILADTVVDEFDPRTGEFSARTRRLSINLGEQRQGRILLGTEVSDPEARELINVYYDAKRREIVEELVRWTKAGKMWRKAGRAEAVRRVALARKGRVHLARETNADDPGQFQALLDLAIRQGHSICADTDAESPVWNGVVTAIDLRKLGTSDDGRVGHWRAAIRARFGSAELEWLVRSATDGAPEVYVPVHSGSGRATRPDFLWRELPDIASKARIGRRWMVNSSMYARGIISVVRDASAESGFYVRDEHVKHVFEMLYAALSGHRFTIVHDGKRYGFTKRADWQRARSKLERLRKAVTFEK